MTTAAAWAPAYGVKLPDPLADARAELRAARSSLALVRSALTAAEGEVESMRETVAAARALPLCCWTPALSRALRELGV